MSPLGPCNPRQPKQYPLSTPLHIFTALSVHKCYYCFVLIYEEHIAYRQILYALHLLHSTVESHIVAMLTLYCTINRTSGLATNSSVAISSYCFCFRLVKIDTISKNHVLMCPIRIHSLLVYFTLLGGI